jgi:NAD(P)-dependent dehydrogenase (short-subunit alcohol dehydrogenase family)
LEELRELCQKQGKGDAPANTEDFSQLAFESNGAKPPSMLSKDEPAGQFLTTDWIEHPLDQIQLEPVESLLFVHSGINGLEKPLRSVLAARSTYSIKLGTVARRLGPAEWEVDASSAEGFESCLSEVPRPDFVCFVGAGECGGEEPARVRESERLGVIALARLLRSMDLLGWLATPLRLRIVTTGIHSVLGEPTSPYFAGLSGLTGSLSKEYPHLNIAALDVDEQGLADLAPAQRAACLIAGEPPQRANEKVAIRAGRRFRLRLNLTELPPLDHSRFRNQGVYLIVGGGGSVGTELSLYLARNYQARLVWIGRRPLDVVIESRTDQVRAEGGEVSYVQGSGDDPAALRVAIDLAQSKYGSLHGVIHSAFVFQDEILRWLDATTADEILSAKTGSAVVLTELTRGLPIDFLLFLNSAQSFFNEARRAVYAAACCFVDAYAPEIQRQVGFPVHVINWGFWDHSFSSSIRTTMRRAGLGVICAEDGMQAIERVLQGGIAQAAYLHANQEALRRMGIDPTEQLTYLSESQECLEEVHAVLATKLFE